MHEWMDGSTFPYYLLSEMLIWHFLFYHLDDIYTVPGQQSFTGPRPHPQASNSGNDEPGNNNDGNSLPFPSLPTSLSREKEWGLGVAMWSRMGYKQLHSISHDLWLYGITSYIILQLYTWTLNRNMWNGVNPSPSAQVTTMLVHRTNWCDLPLQMGQTLVRVSMLPYQKRPDKKVSISSRRYS